MSDVEAVIDIAAPPQVVWDLCLDPHRLGDWVTIHRELISADEGGPRQGMQMKQKMELNGRDFDVEWTLATMEAGTLAEWEGDGPMGSNASTSYRLEELDDGTTRFHYSNGFKAPGGAIGRIAGNAVVGSAPKDEAEASLQKLKSLVEGEHTAA